MRSVADAVGISEPTLYHYFKNRDALVVAAHAQRYRAELAGTVDELLPAVETSTSKEEFLAILEAVYQRAYNPERAGIRATRAEIIGSAWRREELRVEVATAMLDSLTNSVAALRVAQSRGWLADDIDPQAFAIFNLSLMSGLLFPEIQQNDALLRDWKKLALEAVMAIAKREAQ